MAQISANELEKKLYIEVDGQPFYVIDVTFATPSARGASTMCKAKVRNLLNGAVLDKTFKTSEKFNVPDVEKVPAVFQYITGNEYHFMDNVAYEEFMLTAEKLGEQKLYLKENQEMLALKLNGTVVSLELPVYVELAITETDPSLKGASISGRSTKKATLETGMEVNAPLYADIGTVLRVNTETGEVDGRA